MINLKAIIKVRGEGSLAWSADIPISDNPYNFRGQERALAEAWGQGWSQSAYQYKLLNL